MKKDQKWPKVTLRKLHYWNAWVMLALVVTGSILYFPQIRGLIAEFRVGIKQLHIYIGIASILLLLMYIPFFLRHIRRIWRKKGQRYNLWLILLLFVAWSLSGVVLWQFRNLPPIWSSQALLVHDLASYIGIPYALYHVVSRSRWVKRAFTFKPVDSAHIARKQPSFARRRFIRMGFGSLLALIVAPLLYRWVRGMNDTGGMASEQQSVNNSADNEMAPAPEPAPDSLPLEDGGGQGRFRPYTVTQNPSFSSDTWQLQVTGLVNQSTTYNWEQFLQLTRKVEVRDFHCVTGWSVYHVTWEGVPLSDLLKKAGVKNNAAYIKFYSGDGVYTDTLTRKQAQMDDILVAVLRDGKPIPRDYGGPTRLLVPKMYGYKSVKWLNKIEAIEKVHTGYWEARGYKKDAWVRG